MAALSVSSTPQKTETMSNKRVPLANVPNAANSPYRSNAAVTTKRSRLENEAQEELVFEQQPLAKRQALENFQSRFHTPPRKQSFQHLENRVLNKKSAGSQFTDLKRKLDTAKERQQSRQKVERQEKSATESIDTIRQWQKQYRKVFPEFVFYFESIPPDVRLKCSKYIRALGAREEKFFSREVTHIVTTRTIPPEIEANSPTELFTSSVLLANPTAGVLRPTNPPSLDQSQPTQPRNKLSLEPSAGRRVAWNGYRDVEPRKQNGGNFDIIVRAREMGMKIWQLEKLQRVMTTIFDTPAETSSQQTRKTRNMTTLESLRDNKDADLSRMLQNELRNGPSDRDATVPLFEVVPFKGPHIYIRDVDERTKPVMVREYSKVSRNEKGEWPQFRCVSAGKCPFVEELDSGKLDMGRSKAREAETVVKAESRSAPKTRTATAPEKARANLVENPAVVYQKQPLNEVKNAANLDILEVGNDADQTFCVPPPRILGRARSPVKGSKSAMATTGPRLFGGEPAASGLQPSNITSAIRSQMISSTAAAPGAKAGTSREFQGLKRKVLERNSGAVSNKFQISHKTVDSLGSEKVERSVAAARKIRDRAPEKLIYVDEESTQSEEEDIWMGRKPKRADKLIEKNMEKKESKPGYCENCRDKYDDFDEHVVGRKHRKFAITPDNWKDLDRLLSQLGRQLKDEDSDGF